MSVKNWVIQKNTKDDKEKALNLAIECGIDNFTALLLVSKGISDVNKAQFFLSDNVQLPDPFCLNDMDKAVKRIGFAIENKEKIAIFGDYDADGCTATALMQLCLSKLNADVFFRVPTREEGYGLNKDVINEFKEKGVSLIVTVDNGITAIEEAEYAKQLAIDLIITDHHLPLNTLPNATAVVNPHRADDKSEFKDYAGVGVAFMLAAALNNCSCEQLLPLYGDLVMIGTIADVMPLRGYNRALVKSGLECLKEYKRPGLLELINQSGYQEKPITAETVAFGIAPRINAAGRILNATFAVELLLIGQGHDPQEIAINQAHASILAKRLCEANIHRQKLQSEILERALLQIANDPKALYAPILTVCGEDWHHGVIGIVAANLMQKFGKPVIVFSKDNDSGKIVGSARSYKGISIYQLISNAKHLLNKFGGHETAAGLSLDYPLLFEAVTIINNSCKDNYEQLPFEDVNLCCKLNPENLDIEMAYKQQLLQPFGFGNEQPLFGLFSMKIQQIAAVGNGNHLRLSLFRDGIYITAMKFSTTKAEFEYTLGDEVDVAVIIDINSYMGNDNLSVIIREIRPSLQDWDSLLSGIRKHEKFLYFGIDSQIGVPDRDEIAHIYKCIRAKKTIMTTPATLCLKFGTKNYLKTRIILDVLSELKLIELKDNELIVINHIEHVNKVMLDDSEILKSLAM